MAKGKKQVKRLPTERVPRAKLTAEESLKRVREFSKRKERFVAAVRKGKDRGVSADVPRPEYQDLLAELEEEFTYAFGGCTTLRGLEGNYLFRLGLLVR